MSKRLGRVIFTPRDLVPTPEKAVLSLVPYLPVGLKYYEPCVGDGALIRALEKRAMIDCVGCSDIKPDLPSTVAATIDATKLTLGDIGDTEMFITNPPWTPELFHPILDNLLCLRPIWFLLYTDWLFTKQAVPYLPWIRNIVTMPRVRWIAGSTGNGTDNCCWIHFDGRGRNRFMLSGW